jgi:hypothetical protein
VVSGSLGATHVTAIPSAPCPAARVLAGGTQLHAAGAREIGLEPHTEADVARTMNATLGFLAAAGA